ncbi:phage tail protein [Altererythrobacter endophyticus]|uniref:Phage tail protein n=2 Tax=Altericroceibacterium endophyticum TaxID=1808508 RepID=A0A6I4T3Y6_9SPHN|nr:phage tail sheath subtilisin-like domain-containing protein [Altericroceibacterium endophyticum]MXO64861.1 phage tail protein [Altericroceibacterium endophyticum]
MHGIKVNERITGTRPIEALSTAIIGLLCTASAADDQAADLEATFPLDTPVLVTDIRKAIGQAGTGGTLKPALEAIADQCSPVLVVVRVAEGDDPEENDTKLIGTVDAQNTYTGMQAFLAAQTQLGFSPRILVAPGLDTQPVTTALLPIARSLRGIVYAQGEGENVADALTYADNFSDRELMLIWPRFAHEFLGDTIARAAGLRAKIDQEIGWHKTLSNVAVSGITGLDRDIGFDLLGGDNDAQTLNAAGITTLIRRDGFRFWGNRTMSDEPLFAFESAVRTAQVLKDEIAAGLAWAQDKPLTRVLVNDIVETIRARFRRLIAQGRLIGGDAWYDPALNSDGDLAAGRLTVDFDFTPAAPLEGLTINQRITDRYYASFSDLVAA